MGIWLLQLEFFVTTFPIIFAMQFNTALCFVLTGGAFIVTAIYQPVTPHFLSAPAGLLAGLSLLQYWFGTSIGIDTLLLDPFVSIGASEPGRMSPTTAICFLLVAIGLSLSRADSFRKARMGLGLATICIATFTVIGYAIHLESSLDWIGVPRMSPHTGIGFIALGFGLVHTGSNNGRIYVILLVAPLLLILFAFFVLVTQSSSDLSQLIMTYLLLEDKQSETMNKLSIVIVAAVLLYLGLTLYALWHARRSIQNMRAVERSKAQMAAIIDQVTDGIILIDERGSILSANEASVDMFGFERSEMIGQNVSILMPQDIAKHHQSYIENSDQNSIAKIISNYRKLEARHKCGRTFPIELSVSRIDAQEQVMFSGMIRDISHRRQTEAALLAANAELEDFAYRTSHDLRSPVASAIGLVRICETQLQDRELALLEENLTRLHKNFLRLDSLIENIIEVTRARLMVEGPTEFPVRETIEELLTELSHLDGYADMTLHIDIDPELAIETSLTKFQMIIRNLLSNAVKYRDRNEAKSKMHISAQQSDQTLVLTFTDNGIGIPPEAQPKLFEMFRRFHPKVAVGSGLGMYIMKKCSEALGGSIRFEPQPKGSRFILELPNGGYDVPEENPDRR
ncbi:PAS domain S-box protein [Cohaesibacter sp. CAU 1516]|uniref:sensor histidine kinase n=1 Tax=Cohaesibacter sp. CAU 1516 TaxID=2576038 RepID=UPI0010FE71AD|nr:PAS domain-containing sensor histidine kinase [Cohaesibacter sp. CAU 1516]TLP44283.1 PAS domain S-box protein [Cohaesibacter sp. CAU 1516]